MLSYLILTYFILSTYLSIYLSISLYLSIYLSLSLSLSYLVIAVSLYLNF